MKIQPAQFPYFFYGTLMSGGTYYDKIKRFQSSVNTAYVMGKLYYNEFIDENGKPAVTAALEPTGVQQIKGTLFYGSQQLDLELQSIVDELEFNFHIKDKDVTRCTKRDRTYLRNLVLCTTQNGESHLAWCYIYYSKTDPLKDSHLVNTSEEIGAQVEYVKKTYEEFMEIIESRK